MKGEKQRRSGYTIIEVLIVLAVSGIVFLAAVTFISGKQARTAYKAGVGEMASRIEDIIQQVNDGHFTDKNFSCISNDASGPHIAVSPPPPLPGDSTQGTNSSCIFVGKFIRFQDSSSFAYQVFQLAGNRVVNTNQPASTLTQVKPVPVIDDTVPPVVDLTLNQTVPQHLTIRSVTVTDSNGTHTDAHGFGIIQGFGSTGSDPDHTYNTGAQSVNLMEANSVDTTSNPRSYILSDVTSPSYPTSITSVAICITDDTRYAIITVGENSNKLGVSVKYVNTCS